MPRVRKLSANEVAALEATARHQSGGRPKAPSSRSAAYQNPPFGEDVQLRLDTPPRLGDIVLFENGVGQRDGIVTHVWWQAAGWNGVEVLYGAKLRSVEAIQVRSTIGRPPGISRIDQPIRRTHGWFVRVYKAGRIFVARMFSDGKFDGPGPALRAARHFHEQALRERDRSDAAPLKEQEVAGS